MTRIGFFTGKIYEEVTDPSTIKECCTMLNDKDPVIHDEEARKRCHEKLKHRCIGCYGCPASTEVTFE